MINVQSRIYTGSPKPLNPKPLNPKTLNPMATEAENALRACGATFPQPLSFRTLSRIKTGLGFGRVFWVLGAWGLGFGGLGCYALGFRGLGFRV